MNTTTVQAWIAAINGLLQLGVPIAKLISLIRSHLSPEDAQAVLREVLLGWQAAKAENDARIAELQSSLG